MKLHPLQRRVLPPVAAGIAALTLACPEITASAAAPIRPHQHFVGLINGSTGTPQPATIRMACFGPIQPGQTGHPFGGQTVAVQRVAATANSGFTGDRTTSIGAFFGPPPPSGTSASYVDFTTYGQKALPTSLTLPCSGSGKVSFVPLPVDPTSRDFVVPVRFVGQP
jgi:hypothetical protein